ncbi:HEPN domain-containing protein [Robertkochia aurantiaca]|uniref:HEPN domain-containing protein n=1 Tax=Robertkochia aurantiaca TaxID=2873700 RepID=UPI001CCFC74B|nr:HEPN domain-containing protein [Robertkochia sp. 3YJGBD-33]
MKSFRTELENPVVERDIIELERKIRLFKEGSIDEERFRSLRLARGVYGQRQPGVQMIRIKIPFGRLTLNQLRRIADVSDRYSNGRLHITTRQDIQIHHVELDRTPELWAELERDDVTLREACGNTVRNVTASPEAGIDPEEVFDVSPYADAVFRFFLRNPVCQEMGRKFKIAFSSSDRDTALTFIHDLGFIPRLTGGRRGFRVLLGGGLGSQPREADVIHEFLPAEELIPITEAVLRIFDRHGERAKRLKARLKFLLRDIGTEAFLALVDKEQKALSQKRYEIDPEPFAVALPESEGAEDLVDSHKGDTVYDQWFAYNVLSQKQPGYYAVGVKVRLGNFSSDQARKLAEILNYFPDAELRLTLRQDILIRHIPARSLYALYHALSEAGFAEVGYNRINDITACPGTDTCNLGIANSTGIAAELERVLNEEYPEFRADTSLTIKISGCMNACGQHNMAHIGFQGMSVKTPSGEVAPALQILLGGGVTGKGSGRFADKVIKIPSKRGPQALKLLLDDYKAHGEGFEDFLEYYDTRTQSYFYQLLKPLSDITNLSPDELIDWGHRENYIKEVGIGECAGVVIDLVATLLFESEEKLDNARTALEQTRWADAVYYSYSALVNSAKALLTGAGEKTNTHAGIIDGFEQNFVVEYKSEFPESFKDTVYRIRENEPDQAFARSYFESALDFYIRADSFRKNQVAR